jgi:hypothetical protein
MLAGFEQLNLTIFRFLIAADAGAKLGLTESG